MVNKNVFLLLLSVLCSVAVHSQSNLQFSQVLTYSGHLATTNNAGDSTAAWTVPTGKVWKIESASGAYGYVTYPVYLVVNGIKVFDIYIYNSSTTRNVYFPVWLKAGDVVRIAEYNTSNNYYTDYFISIVEFNLTP
ncbi:MAG: hypothetical protein V4685_17500 [Bacteroidota bacterium]